MAVLDRWWRRRRGSAPVALVSSVPEGVPSVLEPPSPVPASVPSTRHGSQKRQRTKAITVPCTPEEYAVLVAKAQEAGLSAGGYLRACGFGAPTPRTQRRAPADRVLFAEAIAALNRTGNNLNQMAKALHQGHPPALAVLTAAQHAYAAALTRLMEAAVGTASVSGHEGAGHDR